MPLLLDLVLGHVAFLAFMFCFGPWGVMRNDVVLSAFHLSYRAITRGVCSVLSLKLKFCQLCICLEFPGLKT